MKRPKIATVSRAELSSWKMVAGGESRHPLVIDTNGHLLEWVGIGWIDIGEADAAEKRRYPRVVD